jgi:hypothetical protein
MNDSPICPHSPTLANCPTCDGGDSGSAAAHCSAAGVELVETEYPACPNCKERKVVCACLRNTCFQCGKPVGNITFTVCDECWNKPPNEKGQR